MKIVVLDGKTLFDDDDAWANLIKLSDDVTIYDNTLEDEVLEHCKGADIVLTNKVKLNASILSQLPRLQYVGVLATGYNIIDLEVASRQSIVVTNVPAYSTESVAQMVFAHLLNIVTRADHYACENRKGKWSSQSEFFYVDYPHVELAGKRIGIVGMGNIGRAVARIALAYGMKVVANTSLSQDELPDGVRKADLDDLFAECDIVSLHCPLVGEEEAERTGRKSTLRFVNSELLSTMKKNAILINTSRGALVDEEAVAEALQNGTIAAYAADVLTTEPPTEDCPLLSAPNCYLTPHIAWRTKEAVARLAQVAINNVKAFINGEPQNRVNE